MMFYGRSHGGSDARNACLLRKIERSASQEVDMGVAREQGDPGKEQVGKCRIKP